MRSQNEQISRLKGEGIRNKTLDSGEREKEQNSRLRGEDKRNKTLDSGERAIGTNL